MEKLKATISELEMQIDALNEELREKDEVTFDLQNKLYNL